MPTQLTRDTRVERDVWPICVPVHRQLAFVELITTAALAVSTAVAAAAVSIGIARADMITGAMLNEGRALGTVFLVGLLLLAAVGGLGAVAGAGARRN
jgi:hypothetical protein